MDRYGLTNNPLATAQAIGDRPRYKFKDATCCKLLA